MNALLNTTTYEAGTLGAISTADPTGTFVSKSLASSALTSAYLIGNASVSISNTASSVKLNSLQSDISNRGAA